MTKYLAAQFRELKVFSDEFRNGLIVEQDNEILDAEGHDEDVIENEVNKGQDVDGLVEDLVFVVEETVHGYFHQRAPNQGKGNDCSEDPFHPDRSLEDECTFVLEHRSDNFHSFRLHHFCSLLIKPI